MNTKNSKSKVVKDKWEKIALARKKTLKKKKLISHKKLWSKTK